MVSLLQNHGRPVMMRRVVDWKVSSFFLLEIWTFEFQAGPAYVIMGLMYDLYRCILRFRLRGLFLFNRG